MKIRYLLIAVFMAGPAYADDSSSCANKKLDADERIAACERVLIEATDRTEALVALGMAYYDVDRMAEAIGPFSAALDIAPQHTFALMRRSVAFNGEGRYREALEDLERYILIKPDDSFGHYRKSVSLRELGDFEGTLASADRAIALDENDYYYHYQRSVALKALQRHAEAADSLSVAASNRPLSINVHLRAYKAHLDVGRGDRAAYHGRIAYTLNPNQLSLRDWLIGYVGSPHQPDLAPLPWSLPPAQRDLRYFNVIAPVDDREDMQKSIEDLINFFGGESYPRPDMSSIYTLGYEGDDPNRLARRRRVEHKSAATPVRPPPLGVFRGLFQIDTQPLGPNSPLIVPKWGDTEPSQLWPLRADSSLGGVAEFIAVCKDAALMPSVAMGCIFGRETVPVGDFEWQMSVTTERLHVPMGIFDTYKVSFSMTGKISILTKTNPITFASSYWIAPDLGTWIAGIITIGDQFSFSQAMEIAEASNHE